MTLWRLEWLRLVRSRRLVALVFVYLFFGLTGPLSAAYLPELVERFGGGIVLDLPEVVPADGLTQYTANANQIGMLVAVIVISGALVLDAIPEMSIFLRTRVRSIRRLLWPRMVMSTAAVAAAVIVGTAAAWYETVVLLGPVPLGPLAIGTGYTLVYVAFVVALVAAVGSRTGATLATVATSVVVMLGLPLLGLFETVGTRLPSHLLGATDSLVRGTAGWGDYLQATVVTTVLTAALVAMAYRMADHRQL